MARSNLSGIQNLHANKKGATSSIKLKLKTLNMGFFFAAFKF